MSSTKRVLIVDDSATVRHQLRAILEAEGLEVIEATNGDEGISQAASQAADLVILDVNMPGTDGLEMLAKLRKLDNYASTPAFVLTAESSPALIERGRAIGATAWILKPINAATLARGVRQVLAMPAKRKVKP